MDEVAVRESNREETGYTDWSVRQFYEGFVSTTPRTGVWLDTTDLTPEDTVETILARTL